MIDPDIFTDDQKKFLSLLVSDLEGPTATGSLLRTLESTIWALKPDWDLNPSFIKDDDDLKSDIEVCLAALQYMKVKQAAED